VRSWKKRLRTFVGFCALPFWLLGTILEELLITRSFPPDMECVGMNEKECGLFTDPDCSKCGFYEPKCAYLYGVSPR
jgi:hypothetical protein